MIVLPGLTGTPSDVRISWVPMMLGVPSGGTWASAALLNAARVITAMAERRRAGRLVMGAFDGTGERMADRPGGTTPPSLGGSRVPKPFASNAPSRIPMTGPRRRRCSYSRCVARTNVTSQEPLARRTATRPAQPTGSSTLCAISTERRSGAWISRSTPG